MADTTVVIDTDVFIRYLRVKSPVKRAQSVLRKLVLTFPCSTTVITAYELFAGVRDEHQAEAVRDVVAMVGIVPLGKDEVERIGRLAASLRASGHDIGAMDSVIAGMCVVNGMAIVTGNVDHFIRVSDLLVIPIPIVEAYDTTEAIVEAARKENERLRQEGRSEDFLG